MTAAWRLAIFSEVVSNSVRIGVSNFCTSLCERSCTRNVNLNSPPRDRSGKALFRKFRVRNKELTVTKFAEKGLSGSISRLGGVPRAINSSLESERRGGRSTSRSYLIDAREANRIEKGGLRQHL